MIGYNPLLPTLIKSSGAKNCRVSIPVCEPYTKPLGTKCRPVWVGGSLKILLLTPTVNHTPGPQSRKHANEPPPIRVSPFPLWFSSVCPSPTIKYTYCSLLVSFVVVNMPSLVMDDALFHDICQALRPAPLSSHDEHPFDTKHVERSLRHCVCCRG